MSKGNIKIGGSMLPNFKTNNKTAVIKTVWYLWEEKKTEK